MANENLRIEILLEEVVKKRASDLHLQVGLPPMLRVDGSLAPIAFTAFRMSFCYKEARVLDKWTYGSV